MIYHTSFEIPDLSLKFDICEITTYITVNFIQIQYAAET